MPSLFSDPTRAKELLGHHSKPLTAVTDWIDRICDPSKSTSERDINSFIIELVETINLQPTGPEEASRAIRKQLKHGRPSQQAKSITILEALVLNGGDRFRSTFADARLVECLKSVLADFRTDVLLRRRILLMLSDWERLYGSDPKMIVPSSLFKSCGGQDRLDKISTSISASKGKRPFSLAPSSTVQRSIATAVEKPSSVSQLQDNSTSSSSVAVSRADLKNQKKEIKKKQRRLKSSSIDQRYRTDLTLPDSHSSRLEFDINRERPRILQAVATASQSANNLVNRLQLSDPTQIATDPIVEALVDKVKLSQKGLVRYIQTVSDHDSEGEYLGTLLNTNAQVLAALDLFNDLTQSKLEDDQVDQLADRLKNAPLPAQQPDTQEEFDIFNDANRSDPPSSAIAGPKSPSADLFGLDFGTTTLSKAGGDQLQSPLVPNPAGASNLRPRASNYDTGTLSDFSDFDNEDSSNCSSSQDGDTNDTSEMTTSPSHIPTPLSTNNPFHKYLDSSLNRERLVSKPGNPDESLDPFADPFLDPSSTSGR